MAQLINRITDRYVSFERPIANADAKTAEDILKRLSSATGAKLAGRKVGACWVIERDGVVVTSNRRSFSAALSVATGLDIVTPRTR